MGEVDDAEWLILERVRRWVLGTVLVLAGGSGPMVFVLLGGLLGFVVLDIGSRFFYFGYLYRTV
ncbi:hypothetical protein Dimus_017342 [Dionaea muscipula]